MLPQTKRTPTNKQTNKKPTKKAFPKASQLADNTIKY